MWKIDPENLDKNVSYIDLSWKLTELLLSVVFKMYGKWLKKRQKSSLKLDTFPYPILSNF